MDKLQSTRVPTRFRIAILVDFQGTDIGFIPFGVADMPYKIVPRDPLDLQIIDDWRACDDLSILAPYLSPIDYLLSDDLSDSADVIFHPSEIQSIRIAVKV